MDKNEKNNLVEEMDGGAKLAELSAEELAAVSQIEVEENKIRIVSPGRMVLKRFFRSKLSVIGLVTLILLFSFALFGPMFSPWGEEEVDTRPTPVFTMHYRMAQTDRIEADKDILILAELALGSAYVAPTSETQEAMKIAAKANLAKLVAAYDFEDGEVAEVMFGDDTVFFEVEFDMDLYTVYVLKVDESTQRGYSHISTDLVRSTDNSLKTNLNDVPTKDHWLGTDAGGYDVFTRLMYGGRISLTLGFVVVLISATIGILMGGIAGYFGKWVDLLVMRIIDVIYCLPSLPIMLIFSAILDGMNLNETLRLYMLMALLSLLGWAGIARTVRGQILTLREQEFMVAAEALGISIPRRIVKHLVPNVMPQLIVSMTLSLGGTILTEATLSFLGLGIRPPKAAWGTMISAANDPLILQFYPNQWVPAGVLIVLAVLAFNFVGDGLRDAFDPKMKR